jgi:type IV secretory pathway TrbF-like protein
MKAMSRSARLHRILAAGGFSIGITLAAVPASAQIGQLSGTERWTAILTVVIQQPRTADKLRANPLGVFINAINWSKEMG